MSENIEETPQEAPVSDAPAVAADNSAPEQPDTRTPQEVFWDTLAKTAKDTYDAAMADVATADGTSPWRHVAAAILSTISGGVHVPFYAAGSQITLEHREELTQVLTLEFGLQPGTGNTHRITMFSAPQNGLFIFKIEAKTIVLAAATEGEYFAVDVAAFAMAIAGQWNLLRQANALRGGGV